MKVAGF